MKKNPSSDWVKNASSSFCCSLIVASALQMVPPYLTRYVVEALRTPFASDDLIRHKQSVNSKW